MRYLIRFGSQSRPKDSFLDAVRSIARATGAEARNPKWTSYGALELDIFVPSKSDFETFLAGVEPLGDLEFTRDLNIAPPHLSADDLFAEARSFFNKQRYWECHETLEGAWRTFTGSEKRYVQGIILVCAAFVHHQKGEESVAQSVLGRAIAQLDFESASYHEIDVSLLKRKAAQILATGRFEPFSI